jgi:hypothetical protein
VLIGVMMILVQVVRARDLFGRLGLNSAPTSACF